MLDGKTASRLRTQTLRVKGSAAEMSSRLNKGPLTAQTPQFLNGLGVARLQSVFIECGQGSELRRTHLISSISYHYHYQLLDPFLSCQYHSSNIVRHLSRIAKTMHLGMYAMFGVQIKLICSVADLQG